MSALPPKADIAEDRRHVRFVPEADIGVHSIRPRWAESQEISSGRIRTLDKSFGIMQISRLKALRELAVNRAQQF